MSESSIDQFPSVERLTITGGAGTGISNAEAEVVFIHNGKEARLIMRFMVNTSDNPSLLKLQALIFEAIANCQLPPYLKAKSEQ